VTRMASRPPMTARNDRPLKKKHQPSPTVASSSPPSAGPMMRAPLNIIELRAMALVRSSRPTISTVKAWRAGASKALTKPSPTASRMTCQTCVWLLNESAAWMNASSMAAVCAATSRLRLETRSTMTPPQGETIRAGMAEAKPTMPRVHSEWLRR
jgi:hypothetical protein